MEGLVKGGALERTIENVMTGDDAIILTQRTTSYTPQLLHMPSHTKQKPQMHA